MLNAAMMVSYLDVVDDCCTLAALVMFLLIVRVANVQGINNIMSETTG